MAFNAIKAKNYPVLIQKFENILDDIKTIAPNIIINDRLDTKEDHVKELKKKNYKVINFEDLGEGSKYANLVINAIYPKKQAIDNHYFGQDYFILRDEFILSKEKNITSEIENILITFGGVDPNNYTEKVVRIINEYCIDKHITITIIAGFGYNNYDSIQKYKNVVIKKNISNISDYMYQADLIFTSAGRTIYEVASIGTPAIVMGQNEREMTHFFASEKYGFSNLGLGNQVTEKEVMKEFLRLVNSFETRKKMSKLMKEQDLKSGRKRVHNLIQDLIQD